MLFRLYYLSIVCKFVTYCAHVSACHEHCHWYPYVHLELSVKHIKHTQSSAQSLSGHAKSASCK